MVRVRRSHILYDGMAALDKVGADIKDRVVVRYLNNFGEEEAGTVLPLFIFSCVLEAYLPSSKLT